MQKKLLIPLLLLFSLQLFAQTDDYSGTWEMKYQPYPDKPALLIELQVGLPERNILFPAQMKIDCDSFHAVYELLLCRKNLRQLGISRNKYAVSEVPFSLGEWPVVLNGTFDFSKSLKGDLLLTANRLPAKKYHTQLPGFVALTEKQKKTAYLITGVLKEEEIILKKINSIPWQHDDCEKIISPKASPAYFGLLDTIHLTSRDGIMHFAGNKKNSGDIVSVIHNGRTIIDQVEAGRKKEPEDILLDSGLNIISFFADNFSKALPNKGKLNIEFGNRKYRLDFTNVQDIAATFITVKFYYDIDKDADTRFQLNYIPDPGNSGMQRNDKLVGSLVTKSQQIQLALWDDAVEDGDSVSININGKWIVKGFPVKKNPQFLTVTLAPGANTITFVADNLGSIPPNTSILEIIDGKKRKSFNIETSLDQNNLLRIFYDYKPDE